MESITFVKADSTLGFLYSESDLESDVNDSLDKDTENTYTYNEADNSNETKAVPIVSGPQHNGAISSPISFPYEYEETETRNDFSGKSTRSDNIYDPDYYSDFTIGEHYVASYFQPSYVTSIKNQCFNNNYYSDSNNCWIFSTLAAYESAIRKKAIHMLTYQKNMQEYRFMGEQTV